MNKFKGFIWIVGVFLLAACGSGQEAAGVTAVPSTPTPQPTKTETAVPPTLTPTLEPTPTDVSTFVPTPVPTPVPPVAVDFNGIHFLLDGRLAEQIYPSTKTWHGSDMTYTVIKFAPEGFCHEVGCIEVYDVAVYEATNPNSPLPPVGAGTVLKTPSEEVVFQNGNGSRSLRMYGQMGYFANNEALLYEYRGFTEDGRFYILITFPLNASILLSTYDPTANTNPAAIPVPDNAGEMAYNQMITKQLSLLPPTEFTPNLDLLDALAASLRVESPP